MAFGYGQSTLIGAPEFPTARIPMQTLVERVEAGVYKAEPARVVFRFDEIREAHRLMRVWRGEWEDCGAGLRGVVQC